MLCACSRGPSVAGSLRVESLGDQAGFLAVDYHTVVYGQDVQDVDGDTSFMLTNIPLDDLLDGNVQNGQIMHVTLLWQPKAGSTPIEDSATNVSIRHVIIADGEVGLYGGAGYADASRAGRPRVRIAIRDATVRLLESTEAFHDPLSPAGVSGTFTAELDPKLTRRLQRAASQLLTNALGRTRFVHNDGETAPDGA
jgi:hypothetical protein